MEGNKLRFKILSLRERERASVKTLEESVESELDGLDQSATLSFLNFQYFQARWFKAAPSSSKGCHLSLPLRKQPFPRLCLKPISPSLLQPQADEFQRSFVNP